MKILYVEDDPADAELVSHALTGATPPHQVEIAPTLAAAEERLNQPGDLDLVLADLRLPDGSGLELFSTIRSRRLPLALVILTGQGGQDAAADAINAGVDGYITKKGNYANNLPKRLEAILQRYREQSKFKPRILRVLYVEDNAMDADLTRRHLAQNAPHLQLETLPSVEKLLDLLTNQERAEAVCDVLLLDYGLPGFNALDALKLLRFQRKVEIPMVLVTGQGSEEIAMNALRYGFDSYLIKQPGYLHQLPIALERAFYRAELTREHAILKAGQQHYEELVTRIPVGVYRLRLRQTEIMAFDYVSPRFCEIFCLQQEFCLTDANKIFSMFQPKDLAEFMRLIESSRRSLKPMEWEGGFIIGDEARQLRIESTSTRLDNGDVINEGIIKDITEHWRMKQGMASAEARFRTALECIRDAFIIMDAEHGTVIDWNAAAEKIFGYRKEEMIGQPLHDIIAPLRYREAAKRGMKHFFAGGEGAYIGNTQKLMAQRKDGVEFPVELSLSAMRLNDKWLAVGIVRDISER